MAKLELLLIDFDKALSQFENAVKVSTTDEVKQAGCIQYFEFCFELAWKTLKAFAEYKGLLTCNSPRDCFKMAFKFGLINEEAVWLEMIESRNLTVHTYDFDNSLKVYYQLPKYFEELKVLVKNLKANF